MKLTFGIKLFVRLIVIITINISLFSYPALSQFGDDIEQLKNSAFLIQSQDKKSCGSAFLISDGVLVTADHVIGSLIKQNPRQNGEDLNIVVGDYLGNQKNHLISPSDITRIESLDIAKINIPDLKSSFPQGRFTSQPSSQPSIDQKTNEQIFAVGFKNCNELKIAHGNLTGDSPIWGHSSLQGYFGMSGGPVFTNNGEFLGLIDQAETLAGSIMGLMFGSSFDLRFTKKPAIDVLFLSDSQASLTNESKLLNENYRSTVFELRSYRRFFKSLEFFSQKKLFFERLSTHPELKPDLMPLIRNETKVVINTNSDTTTLNTTDPKSSPSELDEQIFKLAIYNAFENYGNFSGNNLQRNTYDFELSNLEKSSYSVDFKSSVKDFTNKAVVQSYPGFEAMLISTSLLLIPIIILLIIWGYTIGYTWGTYKKGLLSKLWITFVVGFLLWPFSFIVYLIRVKR